MVATKSLSFRNFIKCRGYSAKQVLQLTNIKNINIDLKLISKLLKEKLLNFSTACETGAMIATSNLNQIKEF